MKEYAVIVAGGSGLRMRTETPKQFLKVAGYPVLMHTIKAFATYSEALNIILVLPESLIGYWQDLCNEYHFSIRHRLTAGGKSRLISVQNGLNTITDDNSLVAIHDGVRPLIRSEIISASFRLAEVHGSAIASVRLKDSIRKIDKDNTSALDRSQFRLIQTPQTFKTHLIKEAYMHIEDSDVLTDDASVAEMHGLKISLFEGSYENIKITTPEDLLFAETILLNQNKKGDT